MSREAVKITSFLWYDSNLHFLFSKASPCPKVMIKAGCAPTTKHCLLPFPWTVPNSEETVAGLGARGRFPRSGGCRGHQDRAGMRPQMWVVGDGGAREPSPAAKHPGGAFIGLSSGDHFVMMAFKSVSFQHLMQMSCSSSTTRWFKKLAPSLKKLAVVLLLGFLKFCCPSEGSSSSPMPEL